MNDQQLCQVERSVLVTLLEWSLDNPMMSGADYAVIEYLIQDFGAGGEMALTQPLWRELAATEDALHIEERSGTDTGSNTLLRVTDVVKETQLNRATIDRAIRSGELRALRFGQSGRAVRIDRRDLQAWFESKRAV